VTPSERDRVRQALKAGVQRTAECIPIERLGAALTSAERDHSIACQRCQTEIAVWNAVDDPASAPDEDAAVQWVVEELHRRRSFKGSTSPQRSAWPVLGSRGLLAVAATVLLAASVVFLARDREPRVGDRQTTEQTYRTAQLQVVAPVGDVREAPAGLQWLPVAGAEQYEIVVLEVDRTILWRGSSPTPRVTLPASLVAQFVSGKTVVWEVTARNRSGDAIALSGAQRFRVSPGS
jgi:hypothetical protein